jgi:hypothetical protein
MNWDAVGAIAGVVSVIVGIAGIILWAIDRSHKRYQPTASSHGTSSVGRSREVAEELAKIRDWAVTNLQNRTVRSDADQDQLEADAHKWEEDAVRLMEGHAAPSEISDFKTLGTYTAKGLTPLVSNVVHQSVYTNEPVNEASDQKIVPWLNHSLC